MDGDSAALSRTSRGILHALSEAPRMEDLPESPAPGVTNLITLALIRDCGSFTRAAESLGISQPSVSQQVRELERTVGLPVVSHQGRKIALTPIGQELAEVGRRIAIERARAAHIAARHRQGVAGRLTIGASMTTSAFVVPKVVAQMQRHHPGACIDMRVGNTFDVAEMVAEDIVDIGIVEGVTERSELMCLPFFEDEMVCISHAGDSRAKQPLKPSDVADSVLLVREAGSGSREVVLAALRERQFRFKRMDLFGTNETIRNAVAEGLGIAFLSRLSVEDDLGRGRLRELRFTTDPIVRPFSILRRRDTRPTPLGEALIARLLNR